MNLIKERFKTLSREENIDYKFPVIDKNQGSYFLKYEESKHLENTLAAYDSTNISDIKEKFFSLWKDEKELNGYVPVILNGIRKSSEQVDGKYKNIELFNYMM